MKFTALQIIDKFKESERAAIVNGKFDLFLKAIEYTPLELRYPIYTLFSDYVNTELRIYKKVQQNKSKDELLISFINNQTY